MNKICSVPVCDKKAVVRGYCDAHYTWTKRRKFKEIPTYKVTKLSRITSKNWTKINIVWLAGLLEGEGSWSVNKRNDCVLCCGMIDQDIIEKIKYIIGGGSIYTSQKKHYKRIYRYALCNKYDIYAISCAVFPYMGKRRKEQIMKVMNIYFLSA